MAGNFRPPSWRSAAVRRRPLLLAVTLLAVQCRVFPPPPAGFDAASFDQIAADPTFRERLVFAPLLLLIFWIGVFPQPFLDRMQPALDRTLAMAADRYEAVTGSVASWGGGLNAHDARKLFPVKVKIVPQGTQAGSGAHAPPTPPATGSGH